MDTGLEEMGELDRVKIYDTLPIMRIRIEKISVVPTGLPANKRCDHIDGQEQDPNYSIPLDYTVEGELLGKIEIGKSVLVAREIRNGVKTPGIFQTSRVTLVTDTQFKTQNSVYNYTFL